MAMFCRKCGTQVEDGARVCSGCGEPLNSPVNRPANQPGGRPTDQPNGRPADQPNGRPANQPNGRPANQPNGRPANQPNGRPANQPNGRPVDQPNGRPVNQPGGRPADQPGGRPANQPNGRPANQPNGRLVNQPNGRLVNQPGDRPVGRSINQSTGSLPKGGVKKKNTPLIVLAVVLAVVAVGGIAVLIGGGMAQKGGKTTDNQNGGRKSHGVNTFDIEQLKAANVDDVVSFGCFEQDDDESNGSEAIDWIVLDKDGDSLLLISKYGLDAGPYQTASYDYDQWTTYRLCDWLNGSFYDAVFSAKEKSMIKTTPVLYVNSDSGTGGKKPVNKLFILSIDEAEKYFDSDADRICRPTKRVESELFLLDEYEIGSKAGCAWWLRSPGDDTESFAFVDKNGSVNRNGTGGDNCSYTARPAMWITLGSNANEKGSDDDQKNVGSMVTFGSYEQDNNTANGKEKIEWIVLDKKDDSLLLISKYALDARSYNAYRREVTWETCDLRAWLNNSFFDEAFSEAEQNKIQVTTVVNENNSNYRVEAGNDTKDKVFVLSLYEAQMYFESDNDRRCVPTEYAKDRGSIENNDYQINGKAACPWWLRSPGAFFDEALCVEASGKNGTDSSDVRTCFAIRPAIWVNLDS